MLVTLLTFAVLMCQSLLPAVETTDVRYVVYGIDGNVLPDASLTILLPSMADEKGTERLNAISPGWERGRKQFVSDANGELVVSVPKLYRNVYCTIKKQGFRTRRICIEQSAIDAPRWINVHPVVRGGVVWHMAVLSEDAAVPELEEVTYEFEAPVGEGVAFDLLTGDLNVGAMRITVASPEKRIPVDAAAGWCSDISIEMKAEKPSLHQIRLGPGMRQTWMDCHGLGPLPCVSKIEVPNVGVAGPDAPPSRECRFIVRTEGDEPRYGKFILKLGLVPGAEGDDAPKKVRMKVWGYVNPTGADDLFVPDEQYTNVKPRQEGQ